MILLTGAACSKGTAPPQAKPEAPQPSMIEEDIGSEAAAESGQTGTPVAPVEQPAPVAFGGEGPGIIEDVPSVGTQEPLPEEPGKVSVLAGSQIRTLHEFLSSMYGIRLPRSAVALSLESVVRAPERTVPMPGGNPTEINEFAREILIAVNLREISVNDYRSAHLVCSSSAANACDEGFPRKSERREYAVQAEELAAKSPDSFVVEPLRKTLLSLQRSRSAMLKALSPTVGGWLLDCDAYVLAADRDVSFGVVARVIHTAGLADLTRVRLAVLDENDMLAYVPILPARLSESQKEIFHVVGDAAWTSSLAQAEFPAAFLAYSASLSPEDFSATDSPVLPACLPMEVAWDRVLDDPGYARVVASEMDGHIASVLRQFGDSLGVVSTESPEPEGASPSGRQPAAVLPRQGAPAPAGGAHGGAAAGGQGGAGHQPAGAGDKAGTGAGAPHDGAGPQGELIPFVFVNQANFILALKRIDGTQVEAHEIPKEDLPTLYKHIERTAGYAVAVSAAEDVPLSELVAALDALRYRCTVSTMSSRCKHYAPVKPSVYLFAAPGDVFAPLLPPPEAGEKAQ